VAERVKLGELLVRAGAINRAQLKAALGEHEKWGLPLGMTLIELKFLDEETLVRTLARQLKVPLAWMRGKRVKPAVIDLIPAELAREHRYIPLTVREEPEGRVLFLGMQDPGDLDSLDNVSFRLGWKVKPILVAPSELEEALERYYPSEDADPRDRMLDLDPPKEAPPSETAESTETPAPLPATEMPDVSETPESIETPESTETPVPLPATEISDASEGWDLSEEEWEVTAEPEFLILEEVVQTTAAIPEAPLECVTGSGHAISEAARRRLAQLVQILVDEGILEREELIEILSSATAEKPA
jgi:type IV pilus assembly protein PilB